MSIDYMGLVEEFRITMGQEKDPTLYEKLMMEEFIEVFLSEAREYILKEYTDFMYVYYGYYNSGGTDNSYQKLHSDLYNIYGKLYHPTVRQEAFLRVHKNNMERCVWPDGTVKRREDGKIIKYPDAPKVDLSDLV